MCALPLSRTFTNCHIVSKSEAAHFQLMTGMSTLTAISIFTAHWGSLAIFTYSRWAQCLWYDVYLSFPLILTRSHYCFQFSYFVLGLGRRSVGNCFVDSGFGAIEICSQSWMSEFVASRAGHWNGCNTSKFFAITNSKQLNSSKRRVVLCYLQFNEYEFCHTIMSVRE